MADRSTQRVCIVVSRGSRLSGFGRVLVVLCALVLAQVAWASVAGAATITVTTTADENTPNDGTVSLREAVDAIDAGGSTDPDIVAENPGTYGSNDTIVVPANASHYTVGGTLSISKPVVIEGAGASSSIIDGGGTTQMFEVTSGVGSSGTVTFQGLTITGGSTTALPGGGAVLADSGSGFLNFTNDTVSNNTATLSAGITQFTGGGAVYADGNTTTVTDSMFSGDETTVSTTGGCCQGGGAIYQRNDDVVVQGGTFSGNTASVNGGDAASSDDGGGAIHQDIGAVLVRGSTLTGNSTTVTGAANGCCHGGGAIYNDGSSGNIGISIVDSTVGGSGSAANSATIGTLGDPASCCDGGGGLYNDNSNMLIDNTPVTGNTTTVFSASSCCSGGGGVYQDSSNTTITNSAVSGNSATVADSNCCDGGGGFYNDGSNATVTGSTFSGNTATLTTGAGNENGGGAVFGFNNMSFTDSTIGNTVAGGTGIDGGNTVSIDGTGPYNGAGGVYDDGGTGTLLGSTVSDNVAHFTSTGSDSGGGGVYEFGTGRYSNSTIADNSTDVPAGTNEGGGGLFLAGGASLASVTIAGNAASATPGGGVFSDGGTVQSTDSIIAQNSSGGGGANCDGAGTFTFQSLGYNLEDSANTCDFTGTGDIVAAGSTVGLRALDYYGGPTLTQALMAGSPAIDAGNPGGCLDVFGNPLMTDQRGQARVGRCDIGAYEFAPPVNSAAPVVSGITLPGRSLSCSTGTWAGSSILGYAYQWNRDGAAIAGATSSSYTAVTGDAGHQLTCTVTASNLDGSASATSAPAGVVALPSVPSPPSPPSPPVAPGLALRVFLVSHPSFSGHTLSFTILCVGSPGASCKVVGIAITREKLRGRKVIDVSARFKQVTVGTATSVVAAGKTHRISITLNGTGRKLLRQFGKLPLKAAINLVAANGRTLATINTKFTIRKG